MKTFLLPDLGEGLPEAEIVNWHVQPGDLVRADAPLVSVETAKAVVEVPSPYSARVIRLHGDAGDFVKTGGPLVDFELEAENGDGSGAAAVNAGDAGTVVGTMPVGETIIVEHAVAGGSGRRSGRLRATPAVRALAKRLGVDIETVAPSGASGQVTS
ncbi:MAG: E3 binding domain-containing protein, partial [Chromatiales bacterium]